MRREPLIDVPPWVLPLAVAAITVPIIAAFVAAGPFVGMLVAGVVGAAVAVIAIRLSTEPPPEVRDDRPVWVRPDRPRRSERSRRPDGAGRRRGMAGRPPRETTKRRG